MTDQNNHYRYCFACDKWLKKEEVNEVDFGEQPGQIPGKAWYCQYCRKDTGDTMQIFKCPQHQEVILKVWGTCDGVNKEKIFYAKCPQEQQNQQEPSFWEKIPLPAKIGGGILTFLLGILATFKLWLGKTTQQVNQAESKLKDIQKNMNQEEKIKQEIETEEENNQEE